MAIGLHQTGLAMERGWGLAEQHLGCCAGGPLGARLEERRRLAASPRRCPVFCLLLLGELAGAARAAVGGAGARWGHPVVILDAGARPGAGWQPARAAVAEELAREAESG
eukprot:5641149-Lingulodinium_polyedra.AAC.1